MLQPPAHLVLLLLLPPLLQESDGMLLDSTLQRDNTRHGTMYKLANRE
jgi:hypothetical protein